MYVRNVSKYETSGTLLLWVPRERASFPLKYSHSHGIAKKSGDRVGIELPHDVRSVRADSSRADVQERADFLGGFVLDEQFENLHLTRCEGVRQAASAWWSPQLGHRDIDDVRRQIGPPAVDGPEDGREVQGVLVLGDEPGRAELEGQLHALKRTVLGEHDNTGLGSLTPDFCQGFEPARHLHGGVEDDDVRSKPEHLPNDLMCVSRFADQLDTWRASEHGAETRKDHGLVIGD